MSPEMMNILKAGGELEEAALNILNATPREMAKRADKIEAASRAWRDAIMAGVRAGSGEDE